MFLSVQDYTRVPYCSGMYKGSLWFWNILFWIIEGFLAVLDCTRVPLRCWVIQGFLIILDYTKASLLFWAISGSLSVCCVQARIPYYCGIYKGSLWLWNIRGFLVVLVYARVPYCGLCKESYFWIYKAYYVFCAKQALR